MNILSENTLSSCRKNLFAFIALFFLTLIIYSNTFDASWHFDDENNILNNKSLHLTELTIPSITQTFFADWNGSGGLYRPVACLSFALNHYFGGLNVTGYHIVNVTIHFLSAFFLFLFIHQTLNLPLLAGRYGTNRYFIALLSAVLWAVNPVQTQAVTYVVQRMGSIAALFYMMAMYFYVKGRTSARSSSKWALYLLCAICGILAFGSKENAVMLPVILLLFDLMLIQGATGRNVKKYSVLLLILFIACAAVVLLIKGPSAFSLEHLIAGYQNRGFTLSERLLTEPRILLFYISLLLYPMPDRLCLEHGITLSTSLISPISTILAIAVILMILCGAAASARRWPFISFCIIFFFLNHLIESSIFPLELIFEHRNYLPSMLFFAPLSILLWNGTQLVSRKRILRAAFIVFIIMALTGWGHSTYARNWVWKTEGTLAFDCVEKYPDLARPHHNLGRFYVQNDLYEEAINEFLMALSMQDINNLVSKNWTCYNLGSIYQTLGDDDKALFYYEQAQKYQPSFAPTHIRKGQLFAKKGLYDKAAAEFHEALQSREHRASALTNLGHLSLQTGQPDKAVEQLESAMDISPRDPDIMRRLGLAHMLMNQPGKAHFLFETSLKINPNAPFTLLELATLYGDRGMKIKKQETMDRFFAIFAGKPHALGKFIAGMRVGFDSENAFQLYQKKLLRSLEAALQERSLQYSTLAEECIHPPAAAN